MTLDEALYQLKDVQQKIYALQYAGSAISLDAVTVAPRDTAEGRSLAQGILSGYLYPLISGEETGKLLDFLAGHKDELDPLRARQAEELKRQYDELHRMPEQEYVEYSMLLNDAQAVWHRAKEEDDYAAFAPYLSRIIEANRKQAAYIDEKKAPYDALLGQYERDLTMEQLDGFFSELRQTIVPLLEKIREKGQVVDDSFLRQDFPIEKQRELSDYLMALLGIDRAHCTIGETEHPFTMNFTKNDVRITTKYDRGNFISSMYSVIHESGHALYELGVGDEYQYTVLSGGVSMGIHESQSRFFENMLGRSEAFIRLIFPKLKELFPKQLAGVSARDLYLAVNKSEPSLIRTEADELTYCLHIMVRYEIEKKMIAGEASVQELPALWNQKMKEYLGVEAPNDREGVLQDSHWSGGAIGYFPSYALGSAYAAQFMHRMEQDLPVNDLVARGDFRKINAWLDEHIHRYGCFYPPAELFKRCCGEEFDPRYYMDYLKKKYGEIYRLS